MKLTTPIKASVLTAGALSITLLAGCAAVGTAISHRNLETHTKMSEAIFLNPVPKSQQTVYVRVNNVSGQGGLKLKPALTQAIQANGYRVVSNMSQAHYLVQAAVMKAGKTTPQNVSSILSGGYGSAISTGLMGAGIGALAGDSGGAVVAGGLIGSAAGFVADQLVKDEIFGMVSDIQISERSKRALKETASAANRQGTSSVTRITGGGSTHWMRYRTRVVSTADQVNLSFNKARLVLTQQTARSIAGLFS